MAMNLNMAGGAQGMMKEGSTLADGVDEAVLKNIGALAASRRVGVSSLCRCDSFPSHDAVGGFFFDF